MKTFFNNTTFIPVKNEYPMLEILNDFPQYLPTEHLPEEISILWSAAVALFNNTFKQWLIDLLKPGVQLSVDIMKRQAPDDKYAVIFTYLSYGQIELAMKEAQKMDNHLLALYIGHSHVADTQASVGRQVDLFKETNEWTSMTPFERRCWCMLCGSLDYVEEDDVFVTDNVSWQCVLGMYIWYTVPFQAELSLKKYNQAIGDSLRQNENNKMAAIKDISMPDRQCLWFQLLQWWMGNFKYATVSKWPIDFAWLIHIYKPNKDSDYWTNKWSEELERLNYSDWAIAVCLISSK